MRTIPALVLVLSLLFPLAATTRVAAQDAPMLVVIQEPGVAAPAAGYAVDSSAQVVGPEAITPPRARGPRRDWALVGAGAGMAIGGWAVNIVGSLFWALWPGTWGNDNSGYLAWATVPVVGPFLQLSEQSAEEWQIPVAVISSAVQLAGWIMAIAGTASSSDDIPEVAVLPVVADGYAGISAGGRF